MEAEMEVSILEFYYVTIKVFREHGKGIVCGRVAIRFFNKSWTCDLYHLKGDFDVFWVISAIFGAFQSEKPCSRLRPLLLSPSAPNVEVVKYVVKNPP